MKYLKFDFINNLSKTEKSMFRESLLLIERILEREEMSELQRKLEETLIKTNSNFLKNKLPERNPKWKKTL